MKVLSLYILSEAILKPEGSIKIKTSHQILEVRTEAQTGITVYSGSHWKLGTESGLEPRHTPSILFTTVRIQQIFYEHLLYVRNFVLGAKHLCHYFIFITF